MSVYCPGSDSRPKDGSVRGVSSWYPGLGNCNVCGREFKLRRDGGIRRHVTLSTDPRYGMALGVLTLHRYLYTHDTRRPDDPGWNKCICGWEGYWCEYDPHVSEQIVNALDTLEAKNG